MCFDQELEQLTSPFHALAGTGNISDVVEHHLAKSLAQMTAGVRVVTDEHNSIGRQTRLRDFEDAFANFRRHPGVEAVRDDVVKLAEIRAQIHDVELPEADVGEP